MKWLLGLVLLVLLGTAGPVWAQEQFYKGEVVRIREEREVDIGLENRDSHWQRLEARFLEGPREGEVAEIEYSVLSESQLVEEGEKVVIVVPANVDAFIFDRYRLPSFGGIAVLFVGLVFILAGWRGMTSLLGLGVSVLVVGLYIVPRVMAGGNPLLVSLVGAFVIAVVSIYLAHGFNRRTTIAVVSTLITVTLAIGLAHLFVNWGGLAGLGSEEAFLLQSSPVAFVNLKGLLLGGIVIGALGVLDDITTSQTAAVHEIWRANPKLTRRELFIRGSVVGKEHITSLINTLALAYIGASMPALLLFTIYKRPWWVIANTETIMEEVVRTLVGSSALMLGVPITTGLAVYWLTRKRVDQSEKG